LLVEGLEAHFCLLESVSQVEFLVFERVLFKRELLLLLFGCREELLPFSQLFLQGQNLVLSQLQFLSAFHELLPLGFETPTLLKDVAHLLVGLAERVLNLRLHGLLLHQKVCGLVFGHFPQLDLPLQLARLVIKLLLKLENLS